MRIIEPMKAETEENVRQRRIIEPKKEKTAKKARKRRIIEPKKAETADKVRQRRIIESKGKKQEIKYCKKEDHETKERGNNRDRQIDQKKEKATETEMNNYQK